jgi:tryptophan synthase alpha chain
MIRLTDLTRQWRREGRKTLVPFLTAGYPDRQTFAELTGAVARSGCRLMEIGVPFSDPVADGPVIQAASQQALAQGVTLAEALAMAGAAHREHGLEVVLMGYLNPILHLGAEKFAAACAAENVAGVIVPDLPPEEGAGLRDLLAARGVALIDLVAPTTTEQRLEHIAARAAGFLYLVSVTGVTGSATAGGDDLHTYLDRVARGTDLPRYVGFGVSGPDQAADICRHADGVIIGSALLRLVAETGTGPQAAARLQEFLTRINQALASAEG